VEQRPAPFDPNAFPDVSPLKNGSLLIQRVSNEHQGTYRCTPYNIHGTKGPSETMEILVREAPLLSTAKPTGVFHETWSVHGDFGRTSTTTTISLFEPSEPDEPQDPKPGTPQNVTVQKVAQGHAISWKAPPESSVPVAYYYIDYKESPGENWKHWGPITKETSFLAKNLKPGSIIIRVTAYSILGIGQTTIPYEFVIPGPAKQNKAEKAVAAGVVGGILFFIAAIVLSVCAVKICNKRKRRKAEKAYMMVTCPIMDHSVIGHSHGGSPVSLKHRKQAHDDLCSLGTPGSLLDLRQAEYQV